MTKNVFFWKDDLVRPTYGHFGFSNLLVSQKPCQIVNSAKFLTHRVSVKTSLSKFQRVFHSPKIAAILNFQIFFKNAKHKSISKTMLDRAISTKFLTHRVTLLSS